MNLIKVVLAFAAFALLAAACSNPGTVNNPISGTPSASTAPTPAATPDELAAAREYYADNCADCHMENGEGGLVKIEGKRLKVPALTKGHALEHTDEELAKQIADGGDGMPAFKDKLKPEEINNLVRYVRKQFQSGAAAPTTATPHSMPPK